MKNKHLSSDFDTMKNMQGPSKFVNFIVSPHLDDAVFSLGGLIQKETENTKVITVFAGTPPQPLSCFWDRACGFKDSTEAMAVRRDEDRAALKSLGLSDTALIHFPYLDEQYRRKIKPKISDNILKKQITDSIELCVKNEATKMVRVLAPIMAVHADHRIVRDAVLDLRQRRIPVEIFLYQDIPYAFTAYLKKKIPRPFASNLRVLELLKPSGVVCTKEVFPYDEPQYKKKIEAMRMYQSQFRPKVSQLSLVKKGIVHLGKIQTVDVSPYGEVVYKVATPQASS